MHFSSDIWWSSVHIRHSHARWGTSCSLCHKHTGNLVLEGLTHICFFIKLFNWSMMKLIVRAPSLAIRVTSQVMMNFLKGCWLQNPADTRKVMYMLLLCPALVTTEFAFFFLLNFSGKLQDWFLWCNRGLGNIRVIVIFYHDKTTYIFHSSVHPSLWSLVSWFWQ